MVTSQEIIDEELLYPSSDGKPMAENTEQYKWIVIIKENLEILFAADDNVFIAGDLLWYAVPSSKVNPTAPDVMVVFGRPKGKRTSYRQWREDNIPPQVVFEILSPSNTNAEMKLKLEFYDDYGVDEYYIYDPESQKTEAWMRSDDDGKLKQIEQVNGWVSPRLGIKFDTDQSELVIYRPDGERFLTSVELRQRFDLERQQVEIERQRAEIERQRAEKLAEYLRSQGIDPDNLP
jgi:Uma2 family endonuclease